MEISSPQNPAGITGAQQSQQSGNTSLGKQEFLQLLVAQMQNQDPINPMDGKEFASQLAQFNSVEQLINLNDGMEGLAKSQKAMSNGLSNTMAASLTGKTVRAYSDKVGLKAGEPADIQFRLKNIASEVEIKISDSTGNVVRTETLQNMGDGDHTWKWDGTAEDGRHVPEGTYQVDINAANDDVDVPSLSFIEGEVNKVRYTGNGVQLMVNGVNIPLGDVEEIGS